MVRNRSKRHALLMWLAGILCVLNVVAFVASIWLEITWTTKAGDRQWTVGFARGAWIVLRIEAPRFADWPPKTDDGWVFAVASDDIRLNWLPSVETSTSTVLRLNLVIVSVPLWIPAVLFGGLAMVLWYRRQKNVGPGHCQECGYDLTGNVSGTCPECGMSTTETNCAG